MPLNLEVERFWGQYYGYPQCCIESYLRQCQEPYWYEKYFLKYKNLRLRLGMTGFIPCENHMKQINDGTLRPNDLITNRKCKVAYPFS